MITERMLTAYLLSYAGELIFTLVAKLFFRLPTSGLIMLGHISYLMYLAHPFLLE